MKGLLKDQDLIMVKGEVVDKGIKLTMKDGSLEYIDPADTIQIDNGENVYKYKAEDIAYIETYKP
jgi:hypothetical protein